MKNSICKTCARAGLGGLVSGHKHSHAQAQQEAAENRFRLPLNVVPRYYDITLIPGPETRTFSGDVVIDVDVLAPTSSIKVNVKAVVITSAEVRHGDGTTLVGRVSYDDEAEVAVIDFDGLLGSGPWQLAMAFNGHHGANGQGFFASTWKDERKGKDETAQSVEAVEHTVLCTQFESADARAAFPCFDEPHFKATFKVRLIVDKQLTALSNGDIVGVTEYAADSTKKVVEFEQTLKMSTYVVAFVVGPFVGTEPFYVNGKRLQIWCMPGEEHLSKFGRSAAAFGIDYMENYFGIPYPFGKKIDLVSVPGFAWGGMENVGLIVFQKNLLLCEDDASDETKYGVAEIINHELAHQWFGDLVTMRWWNGLWLNESFATFMQYKVTDAWRPQSRRWERFGPSRSLAYWTDSVRASHAIEQSVERGGDAILLVDPISYQKGCSVLYQVEQFLGEEVVRQGISLYLKKHAFGNTESGDLWESLEQACVNAGLDFPVRSMMEAWIFQVGHPEVLVGEGKKPGTIVLTQRPFLLLERGRKAKKRWPVPLHMQVKLGGALNETKLLFTERRKTLKVGDFDWVKLNSGGSGFYRVHYTPALLERLIADDSRMAELSAIERYNILTDARAFYNACTIDSEAYLKLLLRFTRLSDEVTWSALLKGFAHVGSMCNPSQSQRKKLYALMAGHLREVAELQGWFVDGKLVPAKAPFVSQLRPYHININGLVQANSRAIYRAWRADKSVVDDHMAAQAAMVLNYGRARVTKEFLDLQTASFHSTGEQVLGYLEHVVAHNAAEGRVVDLFQLVSSLVAYQGWGSEDGVNRMLAEWPTMLGGSTPPIRVIYKVRYGLDTVDLPEHEKKLRALFKKYPSRLASEEIARLLERIRANVVMRQRQSPQLEAFLRKRS